MDLKTLINYYETCPICDGNMSINTDSSIPSTVDREESGLLISIYKNDKEPTEFRLLYSNKIEGNCPYITHTPSTILRRQLFRVPIDAYDQLQLEISCIDCGKFKYWSNNMTFDPIEKTIGPINIRWERAEFKLNGEHMILSNDLKKKEFTVYTPGSRNFAKIPYIGTFRGLPLKDAEGIMMQVKKQLLIT